jgi:hypothetical protein
VALSRETRKEGDAMQMEDLTQLPQRVCSLLTKLDLEERVIDGRAFKKISVIQDAKFHKAGYLVTEGIAKSSIDSDLFSFDPRIYIFGASLESAMAYYSSDDLQIAEITLEAIDEEEPVEENGDSLETPA